MEEQSDKKEWTEKPFKIENTDLRTKGIVDSKFRLIGINGKKLRIKKNNQSNKIKMVRKKNWQQEYKDFFYSLDDQWGKLYGFKSSSGNCPEEKIKICESKGKVCNIKTNRCINPPKGVPKKNLTKTKKSTTKKSATRKSATKKSATKKSATRKSATRKSVTRKSATRKSATRKSATRKSATIVDLPSTELSSRQISEDALEKPPSIKQILSPVRDDTISSPQDDTELNTSPRDDTISSPQDDTELNTSPQDDTISSPREQLSTTLKTQCQTLIDSIKGDLHNLSLQSKDYQKLLQCTSAKNRDQLKEYEKIDKLLYPHLDDPNFALKISSKKEFRDVEIPKKTQDQIDNIADEATKLCNPVMEFELQAQQKFVRNFLSFQSPYNSLLIFHGLGTGKTCSSISVCEEMRNYYKQIGSDKKIMIIASPVVQENYKLQLFDERKLKLINGLWNLKACTGNKFIKEINPMNTKGLSRERVVKQIKKIIKISYEFLGYTEFANKIDKIMNKISGKDNEKVIKKQRRALEKEFSGRLLVIDEVHNIRANDIKRRTTKNLQDLVSYTKNIKLLLLTATPMFNEVTEIIWLINLMNLNDNRFPIKIKDIFDDNGNIKEEGRELLIQKLNGYVSYVSGENPFTFPFRIFPYEFNSPHSLKILKTNEWTYPTEQINGLKITPEMQIKYLDVYITKVTDFQDKSYKYIVKKMKEKYPLLQEKRQGIQYTMMDGPLQVLNIAYPHEDLLDDDYSEKDIGNQLYGKRGLRRIMEYTKSTKKEFEYKPYIIKKFGRIFSAEGEDPLLKKYSAKIYQFIKRVKNSEGICLIYSNFIDGGCVPIALALEEMGIYRFNTEKSLFKNKTKQPYKIHGHNAKYIMITGDKKLSPNNKLELKAATDSDNTNGEKVKVIIISKAGSEGLDFQNIRQVHILEPWYNLNRADQIIGRGVRNKSHCLLPFNKRTVEVYLYASELDNDVNEPIDMYMYRVAENKAIKIGRVTRLLKENSVDCLLNKNQQDMNANNIGKNIKLLLSNNNEITYRVGHKDNSLICDFMECQYDCKPNNELSEEVGIETYNENYIIMNIEKILNKIKLLFREHYIYEKSDLIKRITMMKQYSNEQINTALDILINDDNEFITDMLGRNGRLVNIEKFYMFQPIEIDSDKNITMYQRSNPIHFKPKKIVFTPKKTQKPMKTPSKIKIQQNMEFYNFYNNYLILLNPTDVNNKINWVQSAGHTIQNLVEHNELPKEILVELALEHVFDIYSIQNKIKLINEIELIKNNHLIIQSIDQNCLQLFQKIIDKNTISYEGITVLPIADYKKQVFKTGLGFLKLKNDVTPHQWITDVSGLNTKFVEILTDMFKFNIDGINNFIGFLTNFKSRTVFKIKSISLSEQKRTNKGQQLPTSGENKQVTVNRLNSVLFNLNPKPKYGMNSSNTKIETIYGNDNIRSINDMELAVEIELILRYLDINKQNEKKWFFNTLEDKMNQVENIKV